VTPWNFIVNSRSHTILKSLIEANELVSRFDVTGIVVFAPEDSQLQALVPTVVAKSCYMSKVLEHHLVTQASLTNGRVPTLNGAMTNDGSDRT
jgi:hypothetical protein